ncbi:MAG TPA: NAD-dependent dehydratase [Acidimicrobiaceae bacterium]|nr:NAD-dependent dehydratase [Acidimicrobiaceae bacterium]
MEGRVLVTGADGFIGSHLVEQLVRTGYAVRAMVQYNSFGTRGWLDHCQGDVADGFEVFSGDVRDPNGVRKAMEGCSFALHLAALIGIPYSYHSPDSYVDTNVKGTLNIMQAARDEGVRRVVHTSTSEVYGSALFVPITEDHPLRGQSPYSATKIGADQIAWSFHTSFQTPVTILRPFNVYGPRQSARAVLPTVITQIAAGKREVRLGSLHPTRDFTYVTDTVAAFVAALDADAADGEVVNVGSGFEISIGDAVSLVAEVMGVEVEVFSDEPRMRPEASEVSRLWASNAKARSLLDWTPEFGGLEGFRRGIELTADWFSDPSNLSNYRVGRYEV